MAFEQPLKADQVGDNNLVSLLRDPLIGTLTWILGGSSTTTTTTMNNNNDNKTQQQLELERDFDDMILSDDSECESRYPMQEEEEEAGSLPRLVRSEVSVNEPYNNNDNNNNAEAAAMMPRAKATVALLRHSHSHDDSNARIAEKKKMSWSENLVEYMDESGERHEPPPSGLDGAYAKPIKSALTRSQSMRSNHQLMGDLSSAAASSSTASSSSDQQTRRYIPKMDRGHHGGLVMPTRPFDQHHPNNSNCCSSSAAKHAADNNLSPQLGWGWYINTTPPTPEMYHSRSSLYRHSSSRGGGEHCDQSSSTTSMTSTSTSSDGDNPISRASQGPNRVFEGLKAGANKPPMGWPSVPL